MQCQWLTKNSHNKLIIFFNGWGMDEKSIAHLNESNKDFDCLHFCDYRDQEIPDFNFSCYDELYLIAWSMGIYMSNCLTQKCSFPFSRKIAFCGTGNPINAAEGIAPKIYRLTVRNFSEQSRRLFSDKIGFTMNTARSTKSLQNELSAVALHDLPKNSRFDTAFIAEEDEIFSPSNQYKYWKNNADNIIFLPCRHYPFHLFASWQDILLFQPHP